MCHDDFGHFSLDKTIGRIQQKFWFPRMRKYVNISQHAFNAATTNPKEASPKVACITMTPIQYHFAGYTLIIWDRLFEANAEIPIY